jgi:hypothetical protein
VVRDGAVAGVAAVFGVSVLVCSVRWQLAWPSSARDAVLSLHTDPLVTRLPISNVGINEIYPLFFQYGYGFELLSGSCKAIPIKRTHKGTKSFARNHYYRPRINIDLFA